MRRQPLRFVLLSDSLLLAQWQKASLQEALGSGVAELVGLVTRECKKPAATEPKWRTRWYRRDLFLWRMFSRLYLNRRCKSTVQVDASEILGIVPRIHERPVPSGRYGHSFSQETLEFIKAHNPDFILRFGFGILKGEVLYCSRLGVWSYHHGDQASYRGHPPGFWEIFNDDPVVGSTLQVLGDNLDAGNVLHSGHFQTLRHSYAKTKDRIYFGAAPWLRRTCSDVLHNGWPISPCSTEPAKGSVYREPSNLQMVKFFGKTLRNFIANQIQYKLNRQNWSCGVVEAPIHVVAGLLGSKAQQEALSATKWMPNEQNCLSADPFGYLLPDCRSINMLFEHLDWKTGLGTIASTHFSGCEFGPVREVLAACTHLSYPFVLKYRGELFVIPEHSAARDVSAFNLNNDGSANVKKTLFSSLPLVDTTIMEHDGKLWAFSTLAGEYENSQLHIHFADTMEGPWRAHPLNPVKTDVASARPAGTPFWWNRKLYRPAQDSASHYGSAVTVNEVIELSESAYQEIAVSRVSPVAGSSHSYGIHTLSAVGDFTLIDGARKEVRVKLRSGTARS